LGIASGEFLDVGFDKGEGFVRGKGVGVDKVGFGGGGFFGAVEEFAEETHYVFVMLLARWGLLLIEGMKYIIVVGGEVSLCEELRGVLRELSRIQHLQNVLRQEFLYPVFAGVEPMRYSG
jgi:hypothetical protein